MQNLRHWTWALRRLRTDWSLSATHQYQSGTHTHDTLAYTHARHTSATHTHARHTSVRTRTTHSYGWNWYSGGAKGFTLAVARLAARDSTVVTGTPLVDATLANTVPSDTGSRRFDLLRLVGDSTA
jgi:hypothetical protein